MLTENLTPANIQDFLKRLLAAIELEARMLCRRLGIENRDIAAIWTSDRPMNPGDELQVIYEKPAAALRGPAS